MAHALLGPSGSKQWLNCPGSARATEHIKDSGSDYAQEGSFAHEVAENLLRYRLKIISKRQYEAVLKTQKKSKWYNEELHSHCEDYVGYALDHAGDVNLVEQLLDLSEYIPESFGTGDFVSVSDTVLKIVDLKYGKGVAVDVEDNTQLKSYALGAICAFSMIYDFEEVEVHIFQPRLEYSEHAKYTVKEILDWAESIREQAQKAWDGVQEFKSGDWCQFCRIKGSCATRLEETAKAAFEESELDPENLPKEVTLSDEELLYWLPLVKPITKFLKDLEDYVADQAINHGHTYEGWKVVEGRSNRVYSDPELVKAVLEANEVEGYLKPESLIGITALEKLMGKKPFTEIIEPLLTKPVGDPTLVPLSDKREPLSSAKEAFND